MYDIGVIHGRFQVLHNDHLVYLRAGKARCHHLVIGITNPDPCLTKNDPTNPERSTPLSNPLTYFERYTMICEAMRWAGIPDSEYSVVPFPIHLTDLYRYYVPLKAVFFLTIYDDWGRRKLELFQSLKLQTEIMWSRPLCEKGISAGDVRLKMILNQPWEHLVPQPTTDFIHNHDIIERMKRIYEQNTTVCA